MSGPQLENGYTRVANEILEALSKVNLSPYESRVLHFMLRKTYGYGKKMDRVPLSQISKATGLDKGNAGRARRSLKERNIIVAEAGQWGFQKDYQKWRGVSPKTLVSAETRCLQRPQKGVSRDLKKVVSRDTSKERKKKEKVKGKPSPSNDSDPRVREFLSWWGEEYQRRVGEPFDFSWGKDSRIIKDRLRVRDLPKLKEIAVRFFDDPWVQQNGGYTIEGFAKQINKLISTSKVGQTQPSRKELPQ